MDTVQFLKPTLDVLIKKVESQIKNIRGSIFTLDSSGKTVFNGCSPNLLEEVLNAFDGFEVKADVGS